MANLIGIVAPSGCGKTTSLFPSKELGIKGLDPKETLYINVAGKPLPMRGANKHYNPELPPSKGGNYLETSNIDVIKQVLTYADKEERFKNIVIDDAGYLMGFSVMEKAREKGYEKWTELAASMFSIISAARTMRRDLNLIFIFHQEVGEDGTMKIKTSGKLIDNTIYIDGLFTFILYAEVVKDFTTEKVKYAFRTRPDGKSTCKSPAGCFETDFIPNDMGFVIDKIKEYYEG